MRCSVTVTVYKTFLCFGPSVTPPYLASLGLRQIPSSSRLRCTVLRCEQTPSCCTREASRVAGYLGVTLQRSSSHSLLLCADTVAEVPPEYPVLFTTLSSSSCHCKPVGRPCSRHWPLDEASQYFALRPTESQTAYMPNIGPVVATARRIVRGRSSTTTAS